MFNFKKSLCVSSVLVLFFVSGLFAQETEIYSSQEDSSASDMNTGIFLNFGGGFAYNLRLADRMNLLTDVAELLLSAQEDEEAKSESLLYGGINVEPRISFGNLVFAPSFGYYDVLQGHREVRGTGASSQTQQDGYEIRRAAIKYKIPYATTTDGTKAICSAIKAMKKEPLSINPIQYYHQENKHV